MSNLKGLQRLRWIFKGHKTAFTANLTPDWTAQMPCARFQIHTVVAEMFQSGAKVVERGKLTSIPPWTWIESMPRLKWQLAQQSAHTNYYLCFAMGFGAFGPLLGGGHESANGPTAPEAWLTAKCVRKWKQLSCGRVWVNNATVGNIFHEWISIMHRMYLYNALTHV